MEAYKHLIAALLLLNCSYGCSSSGTDGGSNEMTPIQMHEPEIGDEEGMALMGEFMNGAHITSGSATVSSDRTQLALTDFMSESGPVLNFYLATDPQATDFIDLGELQGLEGDFLYNLPPDVNFESHKYLIVWCVDFSVNFGYAVLE